MTNSGSTAKWYPWNLPRIRVGDHFRGNREEDLIFYPRTSLNEFRVMIDSALLSEVTSDFMIGYLLGLVAQKPIRRYFYGEIGPPPVAQKIEFRGVPYPVDWIVTSPSDDFRAYEQIARVDGSSVHFGGIDPNDFRMSTALSLSIPREYLDDPNPREKVRSDVKAAIIADSTNMHLFITTRTTLFDDTLSMTRRATVLTPFDALPLVGLYLRLQGLHILEQTATFRSSIGRKMTYWIAAGALVPELRRWSYAATERARQTQDESFRDLTRSIARRVERVLEARDHLLGALALPQDGYVADDVLSILDQIAFSLMGAFDAAACVADMAFGIGSKPGAIGWQKEQWLSKLRDPNLGAILQAGTAQPTKGSDLISILGSLRNSIHNIAMATIGFTENGGPTETLLFLNDRQLNQFLSAVDRVGTRQQWGVISPGPGDLYIHPGKLIEALIPANLALLNQLIATVPVENLAGQNWTFRPPKTSTQLGDLYDASTEQRVLSQLGLL